MMPRLLVVPNPAPESSAQSSAWVDTAPPGVASSRHGELQDPGRVGRRHDRPHPIEPASAAEPVVDHMPARARGGGRLVRCARRGAGGDRARRRSGLQRRRRPRKLWRSGWNPAPRCSRRRTRDGGGDRGDAGGHDRSRPRALCRRRCGVGGGMRSADRRRVHAFFDPGGRPRHPARLGRDPATGARDRSSCNPRTGPHLPTVQRRRGESARDAEHGRRRRRAPRRGAEPSPRTWLRSPG